jgi:ABC-2 type transport system ATP-binding protein
MINAEHISKTFKVARRNAGFANAVKALFQREYVYIHALDDVSFTIPDGQIVGYIGPNGAGKSSTIKILSGILVPDSGTCVVNGRIPWKDRKEHVRHIGVVFGQRSQLWWDVPVGDSFMLLKEIYQIDDVHYRKNISGLTELLGLEDLLLSPARSLSLGQRMRCEIAASLLHDPDILFLDEPTIGLDAVSKLAVRSFIKTLNEERHTTVLLTTHDMNDIEALAQRIILIGKGRILMDTSFSDFIKRAGTAFLQNPVHTAGSSEDNRLEELTASLYTQFGI